QLGNIHVNSGLGQVSINNETGRRLVVKNVFAGSSSLASAVLSKVDIIDTNQPSATQHTLYLYQPGIGISVYQGAAGQTAQHLEQGVPVSFLQGATATSYAPEAGLRWQWQLRANLSRNLNLGRDSGGQINSITPSHWSFAVPPGEINANDPWSY